MIRKSISAKLISYFSKLNTLGVGIGFGWLFHIVYTSLLFCIVIFNPTISQSAGAGIFLDQNRDYIALKVTGTSPNNVVGKDQIARNNAIKNYIKTIIIDYSKVKISERNLPLFINALINDQETFIQNVRVSSKPEIQNNIYTQEFNIRGKCNEIERSMLKSALKSDIDLNKIYSQIGSPRIAIAMYETIVDSSGNVITEDPDLYTIGKIQNYFEQRFKGFQFMDLPSLDNTSLRKTDWAQLGAKNNFDLVITGNIRTNFVMKVDKKIRGIGKDIIVPYYRYSSEVNCNIINTAYSEKEITVNAIFDKGSTEKGSSELTARNYTKDQVISRSTEEIFEKLITNWVDLLYYNKYDIYFTDTANTILPELIKKLELVDGIQVDSIKPYGTTSKGLLIKVRIDGNLAEVVKAISKTFVSYEIIQSRIGEIHLSPYSFSKNLYHLHIQNSSLSSLNKYLDELQRIPSIQVLQNAQYKDRIAIYTITGPDTIFTTGQRIEEALQVSIIGIEGDTMIAISSPSETERQ